MKTRCTRLLALVLSMVLTGAVLPRALAWERQGAYQEGMALATDGTKYGYVNGAGSLVIPLSFNQAEDFSLGAAQVEVGGKWGVIRQDGTFLLQPVYDQLEAVGYGVYLAQQGEAWKLLSLVELPEESRDPDMTDPHQLCPDAQSAQLERGEVVLRWPDREVRIPQTELPRLLQKKKVPGWAFPMVPDREAQFDDVTGKDWFDLWVDIAYNSGLMEGRTGRTFSPYGNLKISEAVKLVAMMDSRETGVPIPARRSGEPWYGGYLRYCQEKGILQDGELEEYERAITRAELALLLSRTALFQGSRDINERDWIVQAIPDVKTGDYASAAIFGLYAKGITIGSDSKLTFRPQAVITRAEVAAIVARMIRPEQRELIGQENIVERDAPAVE